jgi:hypothetical protein
VKKGKPKSKTPVAGAPIDAAESRPAVAMTVAWMLTTLSCGAAEVVAVVMWLIARNAGIPADQPNALYMIPQTLLLVAFVAGVVSLLLTPLVYRLRRARPPIQITIAAMLIGLLPIATIVGMAVAF